jgi:hypothetical protein
MVSTADEPVAAPKGGKLRLGLSMIALGVVLVFTGILRLTLEVDRPLWLDEAQTGMLVMQPTLAGFIRQCTYDINAPLYPVLARVWAMFTGVSDGALRSLPAMLGLVGPLIALVPRNLIDRPTRWTWCALLACWIPGILFAQEARWYTLALALGVANAVSFVALLRNPTRQAAWLWAGVSSLMVLAHYYGVILLAFQGPAYLLIHRRRAIATWPAALAFVPAAAALAVHASRLIAFTTPGMAWIPLLRPMDLYWKLAFFFGNALLIFIVGLWLAVAVAVRLLSGSLRHMFRVDMGDGIWITALCSFAAAALAMAAGFVAPVAVDRYFTEFVPGLMLGLAKFANRFERRSGASAVVLVTLFFAFTIGWAMFLRPYRDIHDYNFETASNALMTTHPNRLVFLWDNPMRPEKSQLAALGGFFFNRAGLKTPVDPVVLAPGDDPNKVLLAHAAPAGSAILWLSDRGVRGTAANHFRPAIGRLDPAWECRNFGDWQYRIIACSRDAAWRAFQRNLLSRLSRDSAGDRPS